MTTNTQPVFVVIDPATRQIVQFGSMLRNDAAIRMADAEVPKLYEDGRKVLNPDGTITVTPPAPVPPRPDYSALRSTVVSTAQSAVGLQINTLTQAQRLALLTCLLYRAGAIDPASMAILPLDQWLHEPG